MTEELKEVARLLPAKDGYKAWAFCSRVQQLFKSNSPSIAEIIQCLKNRPRKKSPEYVAKLIKEMRRNTIHRKTIKSGRFRQDMGAGTGLIEECQTTSPALAHDSRDVLKSFEKCPHGIPKVQMCHICRGGTIDY